MGRKFKRFLFGSYIAGFLSFFCFQYFMKGAVDEGGRDLALLSRDHEVVIAMQDVLIFLQQAESNRRRYIMTNNRDLIRDYNSAVMSVQQSLLTLKQLNMKGSYRDEFLDSLEASINGRVGILKSSLDLAMGNNSSDSVQAVLTDKGRESMESIRATILALLKERRNSRDDSYRALEQVNAEIDTFNEIALVVSIIFGCGLMGTTYFYFNKLNIIETGLRRDLFQARQQTQHAMSRYQDLKVELKEKLKADGSEPSENS